MSDPVAEQTEIDHAARNIELEQRIVALEAENRTRLVRAELKTEAVRAGMVDLDGLRLLDLEKIELDQSGEVKGAGVLMRDLRRSKPWLFGGDNSSSPSVPPAAQPNKARYATEMTDAEWRAARDDLLRRR